MLPASDITEILTNLSALNLQPNTAAAILAAVLAPLLRNSGPDVDPDLELKSRKKRAGRLRGQPRRRTSRRRKKAKRRAARSADARERACASLTAVAKIAKVSRSTVVNARDDLAKEARREVRKQTKPVPTNRRSRAQRFLRDELADGPKRVTDVEEAAAKAHVDPETLERARGDHILLAE